MKNKELIIKTLESLNNRLFDKKEGFYNLHYNIKTRKIDKLRTTFVEAHCAHCLFELGYKKQAKEIVESLIESKLYDKKKKLFRFSFKENKIVNADKNGCSNFLMMTILSKLGYKKQAKEILKSAKETFFNKREGLFGRSSRDKNLLVMQTNLWAVKALENLDMKKESRILLKNIINRFYDPSLEIFSSSSSTQKGKYSHRFIFCDDNFLFCYIASKYFPKMCKIVSKSLLKSRLLDKKTGLFNRSVRLNDNLLNTDKSVYKNAICLIGLKAVKNAYHKRLEKAIINKLYNKKEKLFWECFADSNLLACWALSR